MKPPLTSSPIQMQTGTFEHRSFSRDRWRKSISAFQQHSPSSRYFGLSYCCWSYVMSIFWSNFFLRHIRQKLRRTGASMLASAMSYCVTENDFRWGCETRCHCWRAPSRMVSDFISCSSLPQMQKKTIFYWCLVPKAGDKERPTVNILHTEEERRWRKEEEYIIWLSKLCRKGIERKREKD